MEGSYPRKEIMEETGELINGGTRGLSGCSSCMPAALQDKENLEGNGRSSHIGLDVQGSQFEAAAQHSADLERGFKRQTSELHLTISEKHGKAEEEGVILQPR